MFKINKLINISQDAPAVCIATAKPITAGPGRTVIPTGSAIPRSWLLIPLILAATLIAMENTGIDRTVSHWFFDANTQSFPWRHTFFLETVMHHWTKYVVILTTCMIAAAFAFTYVVPALRQQRRLLLFVTLAMALAPLTVTVMKTITDRPCPWDLTDFGGGAPYTHLFEAREPHHAPGMCFPAGHASTGFALLAFFFAAYHRRRRALALAALFAGMFAGMALGIGRIAQGAHFLSHVLWSGLVCWLVMVGLYALLIAPRQGPVAATADRPIR